MPALPPHSHPVPTMGEGLMNAGSGYSNFAHYDALFQGASSANLDLPFELSTRVFGMPLASAPLSSYALQPQDDIRDVGTCSVLEPGAEPAAVHRQSSGGNQATAGASQSGSEGGTGQVLDKTARRAQTQKRYRDKQVRSQSYDTWDPPDLQKPLFEVLGSACPANSCLDPAGSPCASRICMHPFA